MIRPLIDLSGGHVCVIGGSRGIGAAAAKMAAEVGASVSLTYLQNRSAADEVVEAIDHVGSRGLALQADAAEDGATDAAVDQAVELLGPLTGMVVSAGIFEGCKIEEMSLEFWERTMAINLRSTFLAVRAAARHLRAAGNGGSIVIYTSTAGQRGSDFFSAYSASKAGQILFMRGMAKEMSPDRIRVNCIAPSWTDTDMAAASLDSLGREKVAQTFPLGRIGLAEDVAGATVFLLSDLASFITGSTVTVDGGMDMRG